MPIYFETWFEVTAHPLHRETLGDLKTKCRGNMLGTIDDGHTDKDTNGQLVRRIHKYTASTEWDSVVFK